MQRDGVEWTFLRSFRKILDCNLVFADRFVIMIFKAGHLAANRMQAIIVRVCGLGAL